MDLHGNTPPTPPSKVETAPPPLDERTQRLKDALHQRLKSNEGRLTGKPFDTDTLAEVVAVCLVAAEETGGSRGALLETLRPDPKPTGGFDPLWGSKTYELVVDRETQGIKCLRCERTSYHPEDVRHLYCGNCHEFHNES